MSWLDNAICFLSPELGYKREMWRQSLEEVRNYDAGDYGRGNKNWRATNEAAELTDRGARDIIRARARDLERNSDMMLSVISAYKRNVVGGGYTLQARTSDAQKNKEIEQYWSRWTKKQNCDVTGQQSFNQIMRMVVERKKVDGGILLHKVYQAGGFVPLKLQCIEVDELDGTQIVPFEKGNKVIGGIELNEYNKPQGYWIKQYSLDGFSMENAVHVPAKNIIFFYSKKRPSQIREMSDVSATITRIRDVNEYMAAVSVKERILACLSVFIKRLIPESTGTGRGRISGEGKNKYDYDGKTLVPGMIKNLNPGDEVQVVNPNGQAANASDYIKLQQRIMGAGQGLSYETTSRDMAEATYSSARQGSIEDDLTYEEDKELLKELMSEIYESFVISLYIAGVISFDNFWKEKENYLSHEWIQTAKKWVDPAKEANANKIALETGQKTFQQIAAETGKDWQEQLEDMKKAMDYADKLGIGIGEKLYGKENKTG